MKIAGLFEILSFNEISIKIFLGLPTGLVKPDIIIYDSHNFFEIYCNARLNWKRLTILKITRE